MVLPCRHDSADVMKVPLHCLPVGKERIGDDQHASTVGEMCGGLANEAFRHVMIDLLALMKRRIARDQIVTVGRQTLVDITGKRRNTDNVVGGD